MEAVMSSVESSQNKQQLMFVYFDNNCVNDVNEYMTRAHCSLNSRKFCTKWMKSEQIMDIESHDNFVFIMESFDGEVYDHLVARNATIISPLVVLYCVKYDFNDNICTLIPNTLEPMFSHCMNSLTVCITGFNGQQQYELTRKIKQMGATFTSDLTTSVTHLVSDSVLTEKYMFASYLSMKVLTSDWVNQCWLKYQYKLVNADQISEQYKTPIFNKMNIFIARHQFESEKLLYIQDNVESNGGQLITFINSDPIDNSSAVMLVCDNSEIDSTQCVDGVKRIHIQWFYDSLKNGYALPIKHYLVSAHNANRYLKIGNEDTKYGDNNSVESNQYINNMFNRLKLCETGEIKIVNNKRKAPFDTGFPKIPPNLELPKRIREALDRNAKSTEIRKSQFNKSLAESYFKQDREETPICWNDDMVSPNSEPDFDAECTSEVSCDLNDNFIGETRDELSTIKNTHESTLKSVNNWSHNDLMILNKIPYLPKFVFSGYNSEKEGELSEIVRNLNGEVLTDDTMISATHLITKSIDVCTEKVLSALARGIWILRDQYIYESNAKHKFLNETEFEWSYFVKKSKSQTLTYSLSQDCCLAAAEWRQHMIDKSHNGAFEHLRVLIVGNTTKLSCVARVLRCGKASVHYMKADTKFNDFDYAFVDTSELKPRRSYRLNELIKRKMLYDLKFVYFYLINGPSNRAISSYFDKYCLKRFLIKSYNQFGKKIMPIRGKPR